MSGRLPPLKSGQVAFTLDKSGMPHGFVVTKATMTGKQERLWRINQLTPKKWQLSLWYRRDDKPPVPHGEAYEVSADSKQHALARAREIILQCEKAWNPESKTAIADVPVLEQERWLDAWTKAHQSEWPNLFSVPKGRPVDDAIAADLIARGFRKEATLQIAKLAVKTRFTQADKLNVWLVTNWFHGRKLASKTPEERLELVKETGRPAATLDMIKKRLSRLCLTHR